MMYLITFTILIVDIFLTHAILHRLISVTISLRNAVLFLINSATFVWLILWSANNASPENLSGTSAVDKIIHLNALLITIRNTLIITSLLYLVYGGYTEYNKSKKKFWLFFTIVIGILSISLLIIFAMAGSFII